MTWYVFGVWMCVGEGGGGVDGCKLKAGQSECFDYAIHEIKIWITRIDLCMVIGNMDVIGQLVLVD